MDRTCTYASKSACRQRHAALVYKSGRIINVSTNKYHNDPKEYPLHSFNATKDRISVHAEVAAIKRLKPEQVAGSTLYLARISADGAPMLSRPCERCTEILIAAGVRKVVYTDLPMSEDQEVAVAA